MGYTHYWTIKNNDKLGEALASCVPIVEAGKATNVLKGGHGVGDAEASDDRLWCNGDEDKGQDHETFGIWNDSSGHDFCKTARKDYDVYVVACLATIKYIMGDDIDVRSDGGSDDWKRGVAVAKVVTKLDIKNPIS